MTMTVDRLAEKVKERIDVRKDANPADPFDSLCWFISYREASTVFDSFRTKDLAMVIQEGGVLAGPYKTRENVEGWIESVEEVDTGEEAWEWLDEAMDKFYGVAPRV